MQTVQPPPTLLDYRPLPPRAMRRARWVRIALLTTAILAFHVTVILTLNPLWPAREWLGGGAMGTPASPIDRAMTEEQIRDAYVPRAVAYLAIFLLSQWFFLMPRGSWRLGAPSDEPATRRSAVAAGLLGMMLSIGVLATLMEIPNVWLRLTTVNGIDTTQRFAPVWAVMAVLWTFWAVVFHRHMRGLDRQTALQKVFRWLFAGTIIEMFIAVPAHVLILRARGTQCYCERGTWTGVAFGCTAALWLFGPGVFLLLWRERRRREHLL